MLVSENTNLVGKDHFNLGEGRARGCPPAFFGENIFFPVPGRVRVFIYCHIFIFSLLALIPSVFSLHFLSGKIFLVISRHPLHLGNVMVCIFLVT